MRTVVSGTCLQGIIHLNDTLLLGPTGLWEFVSVVITEASIERGYLWRRSEEESSLLRSQEGKQLLPHLLLFFSYSPHSFLSPLLSMPSLPTPLSLSSSLPCFSASSLFISLPCLCLTPTLLLLFITRSLLCTVYLVQAQRNQIRKGMIFVHPAMSPGQFRFIKNPVFLHVGMRIVFRERRAKAFCKITMQDLPLPLWPRQTSGSGTVKHHKVPHMHHGTGGGQSKGRRGHGGKGHVHHLPHPFTSGRRRRAESTESFWTSRAVCRPQCW